MLHLGDCLDILRTLAPNSVDALITDPPAGIAFMNKDWDKDKGGRDAWVKWMQEVMTEAYRVLKPGAHGLVWALPRTSHWTATALENAGFEVRDVVTHLFGTGFPKSLDISKAIDKAAGVRGNDSKRFNAAGGNLPSNGGSKFRSDHLDYVKPEGITDAAKQWQGWGTALKPASEHWILVRKPISEKTVAANVLKWGVGGLNIDACRIEAADQHILDAAVKRMTGNVVRGNCTDNFVSGSKTIQPKSAQGRFPANLVLDEEAAKALDEQSGISKSGGTGGGGKTFHGVDYDTPKQIKMSPNSGGASRFFYVAKASTSEKNARVEKNTHPTVKPLRLMEYLIRLVTPPNGTVLDPFMGSGSTGVACKQLGFEFVGIEREAEYFDIAKKRCE